MDIFLIMDLDLLTLVVSCLRLMTYCHNSLRRHPMWVHHCLYLSCFPCMLPSPEVSEFWELRDGSPYYNPYLITNPCSAQSSASTCAACSSMSGGAASLGFQLDNSSCAGERCLTLTDDSGSATLAPLDASNPENGLTLWYQGGADGRSLLYHFTCDASGDSAQGPVNPLVENPRLQYNVEWVHPAACPVLDSSIEDEADCTGPVEPLAAPTSAQEAWMELEMGAIGHFNMGTYEGCDIGRRRRLSDLDEIPPSEILSPTNVDVEGWLDALVSFGAQRAVLVVSHGCGFDTFPSRTAFPEFGFVYNHSIA